MIAAATYFVLTLFFITGDGAHAAVAVDNTRAECEIREGVVATRVSQDATILSWAFPVECVEVKKGAGA